MCLKLSLIFLAVAAMAFAGSPSFSESEGQGVKCVSCVQVYWSLSFPTQCDCLNPEGLQLHGFEAIPDEVDVTLYGCCLGPVEFSEDNTDWRKFELIEPQLEWPSPNN